MRRIRGIPRRMRSVQHVSCSACYAHRRPPLHIRTVTPHPYIASMRVHAVAGLVCMRVRMVSMRLRCVARMPEEVWRGRCLLPQPLQHVRSAVLLLLLLLLLELRCACLRAEMGKALATSVCGLKLLVYEA